jgi:hypothetical protein
MLGAVSLLACASAVPPSRLGSYLPQVPVATDESFGRAGQQPLKVALVLISDTADPSAAPHLPNEALVRLGEKLKQDIARAIPVTITEVIPDDRVRPQPNGDWTQLVELGRQRGVDHLALVIVSSTEREYPVTLFLGWTAHAQPGLRRDNWSLLEFALLDLKQGKTLIRAEGRGWATLDWPTAPGINQWYPVIYLRPQDPERRIWPPTYEGAPNTLRVVSFDQAQKRLLLGLQESWLDYLETYGAQRKANS